MKIFQWKIGKAKRRVSVGYRDSSHSFFVFSPDGRQLAPSRLLNLFKVFLFNFFQKILAHALNPNLIKFILLNISLTLEKTK
jgi:hypothetical protein